MGDRADASPEVLRCIGLVSEVTKQPLSEFVKRYPVLFGPAPTGREGKIRYLTALRDLFKEGELCFAGDVVYEAKANQRKFLILRYVSKVDSATSVDVSSRLDMSVSNASWRLKLYCKDYLLTRTPLVEERPGRRTMVYRITEKGRKRLGYLSKTVDFKREETTTSRIWRLEALRLDKVLNQLLKS